MSRPRFFASLKLALNCEVFFKMQSITRNPQKVLLRLNMILQMNLCLFCELHQLLPMFPLKNCIWEEQYQKEFSASCFVVVSTLVCKTVVAI